MGPHAKHPFQGIFNKVFSLLGKTTTSSIHCIQPLFLHVLYRPLQTTRPTSICRTELCEFQYQACLALKIWSVISNSAKCKIADDLAFSTVLPIQQKASLYVKYRFHGRCGRCQTFSPGAGGKAGAGHGDGRSLKTKGHLMNTWRITAPGQGRAPGGSCLLLTHPL